MVFYGKIFISGKEISMRPPPLFSPQKKSDLHITSSAWDSGLFKAKSDPLESTAFRGFTINYNRKVRNKRLYITQGNQSSFIVNEPNNSYTCTCIKYNVKTLIRQYILYPFKIQSMHDKHTCKISISLLHGITMIMTTPVYKSIYIYH